MRLPTPSAVIPVLDLLGGEVVRAVRGERGRYRPMQSGLAPGSDPVTLARVLLDHPACRTGAPVLYIADLDAIQGRPPQQAGLRDLLQQLGRERPGFTLWLDAGFADPAAAAALIAGLDTAAAGAAVRPVYGSESLRSLEALRAVAAEPGAILSLDCRLDQALDPAGCWQHPADWPDCVIVMTLDRVGADRGPDLATFARLHAQAGARQVVGAGGIRHPDDVAAGLAAGASAWLVASALHDGRLGPPAPR